jgi:hypothetical protein
MGHLAAFPHEDLFGAVFTQRVIRGEKLDEAWERFTKGWAAMLQWLTRRGLKGGFIALHIVRSQAWGGWHVHGHAVLEVMGGIPEGIGKYWDRQCRRLDPGYIEGKEIWVKSYCGAGPAMGDVEDDGGDLFEEHSNKVVRGLQYALRELMGGIERYEDEDAIGFIAELFDGTGGKKLRRLLGDWRLTVAERAERDGVEIEGECGLREHPEEFEVDTVDRVYYRALDGDSVMKQVLVGLERGVRNTTAMTRRLVDVFRRVTRAS